MCAGIQIRNSGGHRRWKRRKIVILGSEIVLTASSPVGYSKYQAGTRRPRLPTRRPEQAILSTTFTFAREKGRTTVAGTRNESVTETSQRTYRWNKSMKLSKIQRCSGRAMETRSENCKAEDRELRDDPIPGKSEFDRYASAKYPADVQPPASAFDKQVVQLAAMTAGIFNAPTCLLLLLDDDELSKFKLKLYCDHRQSHALSASTRQASWLDKPFPLASRSSRSIRPRAVCVPSNGRMQTTPDA